MRGPSTARRGQHLRTGASRVHIRPGMLPRKRAALGGRGSASSRRTMNAARRSIGLTVPPFVCRRRVPRRSVQPEEGGARRGNSAGPCSVSPPVARSGGTEGAPSDGDESGAPLRHAGARAPAERHFFLDSVGIDAVCIQSTTGTTDSPRPCDPRHRTRGGCDDDNAQAYAPVFPHGDLRLGDPSPPRRRCLRAGQRAVSRLPRRPGGFSAGLPRRRPPT